MRYLKVITLSAVALAVGPTIAHAEPISTTIASLAMVAGLGASTAAAVGAIGGAVVGVARRIRRARR